MHQVVAHTIAQTTTAALFAMWSALPLPAQAPSMRGTIDALVADSTLAPLEGAVGSFPVLGLEVRTQKDGRFRITDLAAGQYTVVVRRVGFVPISTTVTVTAGDTVRRTVVLRAPQTTLPVVTINVKVAVPSEFEVRRAAAFGEFLGDSEIKKLNLSETRDLLRAFHSVAVSQNRVLNTRTFAAESCPYRVYVDGAAVVLRDLRSDLPRPDELVGIEVYANSATVPDQYGTFGGWGTIEQAEQRAASFSSGPSIDRTRNPMRLRLRRGAQSFMRRRENPNLRHVGDSEGAGGPEAQRMAMLPGSIGSIAHARRSDPQPLSDARRDRQSAPSEVDQAFISVHTFFGSVTPGGPQFGLLSSVWAGTSTTSVPNTPP